jgi:hypothetical protein
LPRQSFSDNLPLPYNPYQHVAELPGTVCNSMAGVDY